MDDFLEAIAAIIDFLRHPFIRVRREAILFNIGILSLFSLYLYYEQNYPAYSAIIWSMALLPMGIIVSLSAYSHILGMATSRLARFVEPMIMKRHRGYDERESLEELRDDFDDIINNEYAVLWTLIIGSTIWVWLIIFSPFVIIKSIEYLYEYIRFYLIFY